MTLRYVSPLVVAFAVIAVCGGRTEIGGVVVLGADGSIDASGLGGSGGAAASTGSILLNTCAPTTAPATRLVDISGVVCAGSPPVPKDQVVVNILRSGEPKGPGTSVLTPGSAQMCKNGACVSASGTITFTTFSPNAQVATGSYAMKSTMSSASASSTFTATLCHNQSRADDVRQRRHPKLVE